MNEKSRHHYVPQWYLKNFCDETGHIHVLDKKYKRIVVRSPGQICFEWNRYTIDYPKNNDYIEDIIYGDIDHRVSKGFKKLNEISKDEFVWTVSLVSVLEEFVSSCFWRSNYSENVYSKLLEENKLLSEMGLTAVDSKNDSVSEEQIVELLKGYKESIKPLSFLSSIQQQILTKRYSQSEWQGHWSYEKEPYLNITSDRPIVFKVYPNSVLDVASTCFFSHSPRISFIRKLEHHDVPNFKFPILKNMIHIDQAERFVISHSRDLLENMLEQYKRLSYQTYNNLRNWVFLEVPKV